MTSKELGRLLIGKPRDYKRPSYLAISDAVETISRAVHDLGIEYVEIPLVGRRANPVSSWMQKRWSNGGLAPIVVPMMGPSFGHLRQASKIGKPVVFAWDVWEPRIHEWAEEINRADALVFACTSAQAANDLRPLVRARVFHFYEAIEESRYLSGPPLSQRTIDVLQLGRKQEEWHKLVAAQSGRHINYVAERRPGEVVFPTSRALAEGLSQSRISVCFPRSSTHPEVAGAYSTLTQRYLESMISGCIVLGHCPNELSQLFGYNPVIEVDWQNPFEQLVKILEDIDQCNDLVKRNRKATLALGCLTSRVDKYKKIISSSLEARDTNG